MSFALAVATRAAATSPLLTSNLSRISLSGFSRGNGPLFDEEERRGHCSGDRSTRPFSSTEVPREEKGASPPTATASAAAEAKTATPGSSSSRVIYRAQGMVPLRLAVRLKVFHLLAAASAAGPAATLAGGGAIPPLDAALAATLAASAGGAAAALAWLSRRYVGEVSVSRPQSTVTISTLGFWGERVDSEFPASAVIPAVSRIAPSSSSEDGGGGGAAKAAEAAAAAATASADALIAARPLLAFDVEGDRQFLVSLRFSSLCDRGAMLRLLSGEGV